MQDTFKNEIRQLLASGNKIAAIKRYREQTGVGLAEAKAAVESLEAGGSLTERVRPDDLIGQIVGLLGRGEKIEAVKLYRDQSGCGLKEAKEAVDRIGEQNGIRSSSGTGCLGVVLLGIVVAVGLLS
ncbi:MAG: ribosomal protein L7/L12 [Planctomycetaceae bacterium]